MKLYYFYEVFLKIFKFFTFSKFSWSYNEYVFYTITGFLQSHKRKIEINFILCQSNFKFVLY